MLTTVRPSRPRLILEVAIAAAGTFLSALIMLVSASHIARAQTAPDVPAIVGPSLWDSLVQNAVQAIAPLLVAVILGLIGAAVKALPLFFEWLKAHVEMKNHAQATAVLQRAVGVIEPLVLAAAQTSADTVKADLADGKIDKAGAKAALADVKAAVTAQARSELAAHGLTGDLGKVIGPDVEAFISTQIEAVLARQAPKLVSAVEAPKS